MNKKLKKVSHIIKSITLDNGTEFTNHEKLLPKSDRKVYFCNAYSPWQKPLIEKINSMIHRVYSKSSDITKLTIKQLQKIEDFLNNLPRKVLGYKTPNEAWVILMFVHHCGVLTANFPLDRSALITIIVASHGEYTQQRFKILLF